MTPDPELIAQAQRLQAQAAKLPTEQEISALADRAEAHGGTRSMSLEEVRAKAREARDNARQLAELLGKLSQMLDDDSPPGGAESAPEPGSPAGGAGES